MSREDLAKRLKQILRSSSSDDDNIKIIITTTYDGCQSLVPLLRSIKRLGDIGASREIVVDPDGDDPESFGFDGDGRAKISEIIVNGEKIK